MADPVRTARFWAPEIDPPKIVALAPLLSVTAEESEITAEFIVIEPLPVELIFLSMYVVSRSLVTFIEEVTVVLPRIEKDKSNVEPVLFTVMEVAELGIAVTNPETLEPTL